VFTDGDRRLVVVRSWPVDPVARTAAEELASQPLQAGAEVGRIDVDDGVLVVLYG
jgi:hypothetical protein